MTVRILTIGDETIRPGDLFRDVRNRGLYDRVLRVDEISRNAAYAETPSHIRCMVMCREADGSLTELRPTRIYPAKLVTPQFERLEPKQDA